MIIMYENGEPTYTFRPKAGAAREPEGKWRLKQGSTFSNIRQQNQNG